MVSEKILSLKNVSKAYKSRKVVNEVNMEIDRGEIVGLVGRNGAGKTTILRMISGLATESSGEIELFGKTGKSEKVKERSRMGVLVENPALFQNMTARQNLEYYRVQRGITDVNSVNKVLDLVDLTDTGNKPYKKFSMGMKQKLGIALAILGDPEFLILDEPINGLDPLAIVNIRELILKLNRENNTTVLLSSHILQEMALIATKYSFIHDGVILENISAEELQEKCQASLKIRVSDVKKTAIILEDKLNIEGYRVMSSEEIIIFDTSLETNKLTKALVENEIGILSISEESKNLEDYYLELIGGNSK